MGKVILELGIEGRMRIDQVDGTVGKQGEVRQDSSVSNNRLWN